MTRSTTLPTVADGAALPGASGMELPEFLPDSTGPQAVERTFAFLDLCGFTAFTEAEGAKRAVDVLTEFRACVRQLAARRGVRIAKWLGDGVMLVSTDPGPMVATVSELLARLHECPLPVRAGVAAGECLLFEGDDYIGRPVNLAARLSDQARPGQILADGDVALLAPGWVEVVDRGTRRIKGFGRVRDVREVRMGRDVRLPAAS
ncbi:MAG: adenylate/guanylate cyclase domain-containing protein [Acidimicrobiales bacterium]|nr:adenylate/guanylate cyclase domain-containing protein [Acidimicrobiales bacterium]MCB9373094.1 adenylate/guanylate cyclase domain-containing protein [Microthrixaceae bacterium]